MEPVIAWPEAEGAASTASLRLAKKLEERLLRELARGFTIVEQPGPGSLQLRSALGAGGDSEVTLEVELLDGETGRRVIAAVDRRSLEPDASTPQTDVWAMLIRNRLASFRQFDAAEKSRSR